jgi:hypothetical protein
MNKKKGNNKCFYKKFKKQKIISYVYLYYLIIIYIFHFFIFSLQKKTILIKLIDEIQGIIKSHK